MPNQSDSDAVIHDRIDTKLNPVTSPTSVQTSMENLDKQALLSKTLQSNMSMLIQQNLWKQLDFDPTLTRTSIGVRDRFKELDLKMNQFTKNHHKVQRRTSVNVGKIGETRNQIAQADILMKTAFELDKQNALNQSQKLD